MAIKLFAADLDETLLHSGHPVSQRNIDAVQKMIDAGVIFTIATGRMYRAALSVVKELQLNDDSIIISYNGASIRTVGGEKIYETFFDSELVRELIEFFHEQNWHVQLYTGDEFFYESKNEFSDLYEGLLKVEGQAVGFEGMLNRTAGVFKLLTIGKDHDEMIDRAEIIKSRFKGRVDAYPSGPRYCEIVLPGISKSSAIKILADKFKIDRSEILAIGDSENDLEMIRDAGIGVAPSNATEAVKKVADQIVASCIEDGFAEAVDKFVFDEKSRLIIVTGMSGGGKTQASRCLEDLGYFCVDNLPPIFIPKFVELSSHVGGHVSKVVLVVDTRSREFFDMFVKVLEQMDRNQQNYEMLFMDASDEVIIRRYKETRRTHPLAPTSRISEGVLRERELLESVRSKAKFIIDTSNLSKNDLKGKILKLFGSPEGNQMNIDIMSFGFKFGMPLDADIVLDVRFLPNPFYVENLKHKSGAVPEVAKYIEEKSVTQEFKKRLDPLIDFLIPQYIKEGKSQLVIAIGCTGGMHRSVYIARHLFRLLANKGYSVKLEHRDLLKNDVREHVET